MKEHSVDPGSARVPRAGEGLWPSQTFAEHSKRPVGTGYHRVIMKDRCATPKPARETRALPTGLILHIICGQDDPAFPSHR